MPAWVKRIPLWSLPAVAIAAIGIIDWIAGAIAVLAAGAILTALLIVALGASPLITSQRMRAAIWAMVVPLVAGALVVLTIPAVRTAIEPNHSPTSDQPSADVWSRAPRPVDLSKRDLRGAQLQNRILDGSDLVGRNLDRALLAGASLRGADVRASSLVAAQAAGVDLRGADLRGAKGIGISLSGGDLRGADLRGADLTDADLNGACLRETQFYGATLTGATAYGADTTDVRGLPPALSAQGLRGVAAASACQ